MHRLQSNLASVLRRPVESAAIADIRQAGPRLRFLKPDGRGSFLFLLCTTQGRSSCLRGFVELLRPLMLGIPFLGALGAHPVAEGRFRPIRHIFLDRFPIA